MRQNSLKLLMVAVLAMVASCAGGYYSSSGYYDPYYGYYGGYYGGTYYRGGYYAPYGYGYRGAAVVHTQPTVHVRQHAPAVHHHAPAVRTHSHGGGTVIRR